MTTIGPSVSVKGELRAAEDITVLGRIEGPTTCEGATVTVGESGDMAGDVIARDITIFGRVSGRVVATDVVDVRADASVSGTIVSPRFILNPGATFTGRVEPQHLEAALRVARYNQDKRDTPEPPDTAGVSAKA